MSKLAIGIVYHVVDKTTGEVVKVGSTTNSLKRRFSYSDYTQKYTNHFLREAKIIRSSDLDYYDREDPFCPFLWHLVASEHMEILKQNTFRKNKFSNRISPLDQKYFGFDPFVYGAEGGRIGGRRNVESGHWATLRTPEIIMMGAKAAGAVAVKTGQIYRIRTKEACYRGGVTQGNKAKESGQWGEVKNLGLHTRWHVKGSTAKNGRAVEAKPNPRCTLCSEQNLIIAYA
jgi:hypothetical protein